MNKELNVHHEHERAEYHYKKLQELIDFENLHPQIVAEIGSGALELVFTVGMHGNEVMPIRAVQNLLPRLKNTPLKRPGRIRFVVCNVPAIKARKRFLEQDLNDVFPGDAAGENAEVRLAPEILSTVKNAFHVVDLHTGHDAPPFAILPTRNLRKLQLLEKSGIPKIVVFEKSEDAVTGPMVDCTPCGVGIESGPHTSESSIATAESVIIQYVHSFGFIDAKDREIKYRTPEYFQIIGKVSLAEGRALAVDNHFEEFTPVSSSLFTLETEELIVHPLLITPSNYYDDVYMYLAQKMSRPELVNTLEK
jgi:hypothetical protein